jgi:hypothetical protein
MSDPVWTDPATWGPRYDDPQAQKGLGYFGALQRPDGGIMTEYSIPLDEAQGDRREISTLVPTLSPDEVHAILNTHEGQPLPPSVIQKAQAHARQRLAAGQSPFAEPHETDLQHYPQFTRARVTAPGASLLSSAHGGATKLLSPQAQEALKALAAHMNRQGGP